MTMPHVRTAQARVQAEGAFCSGMCSEMPYSDYHHYRLDFGSYLNGAVVTETIFGWDGIGRFTMDGILKRDYPVIMGCTMIGTVVFVLVNLLTEPSVSLSRPEDQAR